MNYIMYKDYKTCAPAFVSEVGFSSMDEPLTMVEVDSFEELYNELLEHKPKGKILAVICYPLKEAALGYISPRLSDMQRFVGGDIEVVPLMSMPTLGIVCNENGKINRMRLNRGLYHKRKLVDVIAGPMAIVAYNNEGGSISLTCDEMQRVYYDFLEPEVFVVDKSDNDIRCVKCSSATAEILRENNISIIGQ